MCEAGWNLPKFSITICESDPFINPFAFITVDKTAQFLFGAFPQIWTTP